MSLADLQCQHCATKFKTRAGYFRHLRVHCQPKADRARQGRCAHCARVLHPVLDERTDNATGFRICRRCQPKTKP